LSFDKEPGQKGFRMFQKSREEIKSLFRCKIEECINTSYVIYPKPDDYKIALSVSDSNYQNSLFHGLYLRNLTDVVKEGKKQILLLGSGGSGKSTYMQYLAYHYSNEIDSFTPVYIKLKLYNAESIEDSVILETRSMPKKPLLLLDGYDELSEDTKLHLHKQLSIWMKRHAETPVVITSRPFDSSVTPFRDFHHLGMSPLGFEQIKQFLLCNYIDVSVFTSSPIWNALYSLSQIPFYLIKIVEFYKTEGSLPRSMSQILEYSVKHGIRGDKAHFETTFTADYFYDELDDSLLRLAFCMTNSGKTSLSRTELENIIPDCKIGDFLRKYTRLIESERNQRESVYIFSHKIFQDYLAAKAIRHLPPSLIIEIIEDDKQNGIRYCWETTIPLLLELLLTDERREIITFIKKVKPSILINVQPDLVDEDLAKHLFTITYEDCDKSYGYIPSFIDDRKLVSIWNSSSMEEYLLDYLRNKQDFNYMLIEAFVLLSFSKMTRKADIDSILIKCLQNDQLARYRRRLNNIATLFIRIDDFDQAILDELYEKNPRDTIQLLVVYDKSFKYIDALIELYKEIDRKPNHGQADSETKRSIEDYLVYCIKKNHIQEVIEGIIKSNLLRDPLCLRDRMKEIVQSAYDNYEFDDIYEDMYRLFVYCIDTSSDGHLAELRVYFIRHNAEYQVVKRVFDEGKDSSYEVLLVLLNPVSKDFVTSICEDLIPTLSQQKQERLYENLAVPQIPPLYNEILEQMGISLEQYKVESVQERKNKRLQKDMDLVLHVDLLIRELDVIFGEEHSITYKSSRSLWNQDICTVVYKLIQDYRSSNPCKRSIPKKAIIDTLKRNHPKLILDFVTSNFKKQPRINAFSEEVYIELSPELKDWLDNWKIELLQSTDIKSALKQIDSVRLEIDTRIETLWKLIKEDLVEVDDSVLLDFLSFDWNTSEDWKVIESKIDNKQQIRARVAENLKIKHLIASNPLANHVWFCTNNHYDEVLPHSYDVLSKIENEYWNDGHLRYCCLESIIQLENDQTRFRNYVSDCPVKILGDLARGFVKNRKIMVGLIERLKNEVKLGESESTPFYLLYLVCLGDNESLPQYIDKIKQTRDFYIEYEYPNPFESITDETSLGLLIDLLSFSLQNEVRQSDYHNLTKCILSSVENIAYKSQELYEESLDILTDLTKQYPKHIDTYLLFEYVWKIQEEMPKRITKLPTLLESLALYNTLNGSLEDKNDGK
jgi:hypothetical protein